MLWSSVVLATAFAVSPRPLPQGPGRNVCQPRSSIVAVAQLPTPQTPVPEDEQEQGTGWQRTGRGLRFRQTTAGTGATPQAEAVVSVHYTVLFQNGDIVGTSRGRLPLTFKLGKAYDVPIFTDAVEGMRVGDAIRVVVPPDEIPTSQVRNVPKDQEGEPLLVDIELLREETGLAAFIPSLLPPGTRRITIARTIFALSFVPYFLPEELKPEAYRFGDVAAIREAHSAAANSVWLGGSAAPLDSLFQ